MNFVGHVVKTCEAWKASKKIWSRDQPSYPCELLKLLFITYKAISSELYITDILCLQ